MRTLYPKLFLVFLIIGQAFSCKKDSVTSNIEFPNNIGTFWKYRVYDSLSNRIDTITIKVVGNSKLEDGTDVKVWQINSLYNPVDTNYVYSGNDEIKVFPYKLTTAPVSKKYVFPLTVGSSWRSKLLNDTSYVISKESRVISSGTYANTFQIKRSFRAYYNYSLYEIEYFKPNIGMITRSITLLDGGFYSKLYWELLSYHIQN